MKKIVALSLALLLVLGLFTGCGGKNSDAITIWLYGESLEYYSDYNANPVVLHLEEKYGIDLEFQIPAMGTEDNNMNLMLVNGEYTDVMDLTYAPYSTKTLYADGVIIDLAPYIAQYMPNYTAWLNEHPDAKAIIYDDEGHCFNLIYAQPVEEDNDWCGFVYRHDILEKMTGGNVQFPSGNEVPTTVADWEYMLPLYKQYFESKGLVDYACLIIPYTGYFGGGELLGGFGAASVAQFVKDGEVLIGVQQDAYRNYLTKLNEWYEKGWVYADFASRTSDMYFTPCNDLTYGDAAGIWCGTSAMLGDIMTAEGSDVVYDVRPMGFPLDEEHGVTEYHNMINFTNYSASSGFAVTTSCSEEKIEKFLTAMDFLYSAEGGMYKTFGLPAEYAADDEVYKSLGLEGGSWGVNEDGSYWLSEKIAGENVEIEFTQIAGARLPGWGRGGLRIPYMSELERQADSIWGDCGRDWCYPAAIELNDAQNKIYRQYNADFMTCIETYSVQFITGTLEMNDTNWNQFQQKLKDLHVEELKTMYQEAYDSYIEKIS